MGIAIAHVRSWQAAYRGLVPQDYLDGLDPAQRLPGWVRGLNAARWPRAAIFVADDGADIAGFAITCPSRDADADPASVGELAAIYLMPHAWGTGLGRELMAACMSSFSEAGYAEATLWVLDTNTRARHFYAAAGWRPDGAEQDDRRGDFVLHEVRYRRPLT
jgi:GNAT superfamily N-acetyltransferase